MARAHAVAAMADAMIAVALAGSVFFSIDPSAARWRVALYLVLTIAPFAVVTPFIGPLIDRARGGRRAMILFTVVGRAVLAWLMTRHLTGLLLFPEAFGFLILQKTYSVAKSALVPNLVRSEVALVHANAKMSLASALSSMVGAGIGGLALLGGANWPAWAAVGGFALAALYFLQVPKVAAEDEPVKERLELTARSIVLTARSMTFLRAAVGFVTFLLAFALRGGEEGLPLEGLGRAAGAATGFVRGQNVFGTPGAPPWHFGLVMLAAGLGVLLGAKTVPLLRRRVVEEHIILRFLLLTFLGLLGASFLRNVWGAVLASGVTAVSASSAKLAFDSLVQRDAPDANYGRFFARYEARFQMSWAVGALLATVLPFPVYVGFGGVASLAAVSLLWYLLSLRGVRVRPTPVTSDRADGQLPLWDRQEDAPKN